MGFAERMVELGQMLGEPGEGWIGVDLDGTLAVYDGWRGEEHIGEPVKLMVDRVKMWLAGGYTVKVVTARVSNKATAKNIASAKLINAWCFEHIGQRLPITCRKDKLMIVLFDDRCIQVQRNTGAIIG